MNPVFTETQVGTIRGRQYPDYAVIFDPCTPVFRAKVASVPTGATYLEIVYDTVSLGAYTDIREGQTVVISATADHTAPIPGYKEMRVAGTPTSSLLPIGEVDLVLDTDYYITVLDTYKALPLPRQGQLIDGRLPYEGQVAEVTGIPSAQFVKSSGVGVFTYSATVTPLDGSTVTDTAWEIPGAVYLDGTDADLDIEIEMPADSHTWGRFTYTLSSGVTRWIAFQLVVSPILGSTLPTVTIEQPNITRNWRGHHATCRALGGVTIDEVMNGTRCVMVINSTFAGGAVPIDPVQFVGYLVKEGGETASVTDQSVSFELSSIWEKAGNLPMSHIAVRDMETPTKWDEINLPTPQKVVMHVLARYSTVLNLCCLSLDDTGDTWYGDDWNLSSDSIADAVEGVLQEINAEITQTPAGALYLRRDLRCVDDDVRDAADVVWTLTHRDLMAFQFNMRHEEQTGRVIIGVRSFRTDRSPSIGGRASAPAVILGTSPTTHTEPAQLMPADSTPLELFGDPLDASSTGLAQIRAGHIQAIQNTPYTTTSTAMPFLFWLTPNNFQWINISLAASLMTRGRAITGRHLLTGLDVRLEYDLTTRTYHPAVSLELTPETRGGAGRAVGELVPNAASLDWSVPPIQQPYTGDFGAPPDWNTADFPPFTRDNMGNQGFPTPPDQNAEEATQSPTPGTRTFGISFAEDTPVAAGFLSILGEPYVFTIEGSAQIATDAWAYYGNFATSDEGFAPQPGVEYGTWAPGGWQTTDALKPGAYRRSINIYRTFTSTNITHVSFVYDIEWGTYFNTLAVTIFVNNTTDIYLGYAYDFPDGNNLVASWSGSMTMDRILFLTNASVQATPDYDGYALQKSFIVRGTGTNPFTGATGLPLFGDGAGYTWNVDEETGERINIQYDGSRGIRIQGSPIAAPPLYNASGHYTFEWTGDGSIPSVVYIDDNYTDNQHVNLNVRIEGPNA